MIEYVKSCAAGNLGLTDCGPVWQLGLIAALLVIAITALVVLRVRAVTQAQST